MYDAWLQWQSSADKSESNWKSDFPDWTELIRAAIVEMEEPGLGKRAIARLAELWAASAEDETLIDAAPCNVDKWLPSLRLLAKSPLPDCRWQVYVVAAQAKAGGDDIVRMGLSDSDPYARRRALAALASCRPPDARALAERFMRDEDPYMRQTAIEMILAVDDKEFRVSAISELERDPVEHVRVATKRQTSAR
ncbi:MAG TPA: HEAT repeat domain-containing protein [Kofleriaceae bacterium]